MDRQHWKLDGVVIVGFWRRDGKDGKSLSMKRPNFGSRTVKDKIVIAQQARRALQD